MQAVQTLPSNYKKIYSINLQQDKKAALFVNGLALLIAIIMILIMNIFFPLHLFLKQGSNLIKLFVFATSLILYMYLHELVHGIAMKIFGTKKVTYGFTGMYAFAASSDYYNKKSYVIIALAPIIVFLFVFGVINYLVPKNWFWIIYFLQVCNVSGAAGDIFVTVKFLKMPRDILIKDNGVSMQVYTKE